MRLSKLSYNIIWFISITKDTDFHIIIMIKYCSDKYYFLGAVAPRQYYITIDTF